METFSERVRVELTIFGKQNENNKSSLSLLVGISVSRDIANDHRWWSYQAD